MQRSKVTLCLTLFALCWILSCFDEVDAEAVIRPGKTTKGLRRQSAPGDQQRKELQSEDTQLDEPSVDMEGRNGKPSGKKSPEAVLAGKQHQHRSIQ